MKTITLTTVTVIALLASLTACSTAPATVEAPVTAPAPTTPVVEDAMVVDTFVDFVDGEAIVYDGVPVTCPADSEGSEAVSARMVVVPADTADAVEGSTSFFTVECAYPVTDEIMGVIEEINASQQ